MCLQPFHRNIFVLTMLALMVSSFVFAQTFKQLPDKELLKIGKANYAAGNFQKALDAYIELYHRDSTSYKYNFLIGVTYTGILTEKYKAIPYLAYAIQAPKPDPQAFYYLGQAYHMNHRFDEAIRTFAIAKTKFKDNKYGKKLKQDVEHRIEMCTYAKTIINNPVKVLIKNLGNKVNSFFPDYHPLISADGSILVFTSKREGGIGADAFLDNDGYPFEDIYYAKNENLKPENLSKLRADSTTDVSVYITDEPRFSQAKNMGSKINTEFGDGVICLTADGKRLYLYKDKKIYSTTYLSNKWGEPVEVSDMGPELAIKKEPPVFCLSPDEKTLFFISDQKGSSGGKDIYKKEKKADGTWGKAENLGTVINSKYDENYPFMQADGKTLYFSSNGVNSMGGYDIFKSTYENGQWSKPQNLGYPINTADDDIYFVMTSNGRVAYLSSIRFDTRGEMDIYSLSIDELNRAVTELRGIMTTANATRPLQAKINLMEAGKLAGTYSSDAQTGKYLMIVEPGKHYQVIIESEGFTRDTQQVYLPSNASTYQLFQEFNLDTILGADKHLAGQKLRMTMTFFDIDKTSTEPSEAIYSAPDKKEKEQQINKLAEAYPQQLTDKTRLLDDMVVYYKNEKIKYYEALATTAKTDTLLAEVMPDVNKTDTTVVVAQNMVKESGTKDTTESVSEKLSVKKEETPVTKPLQKDNTPVAKATETKPETVIAKQEEKPITKPLLDDNTPVVNAGTPPVKKTENVVKSVSTPVSVPIVKSTPKPVVIPKPVVPPTLVETPTSPSDLMSLDSLIKKVEATKPKYAFAKADLQPNTKKDLDLLAKLMLQYKSIRVEIAGHCDSIGTDEVNQKLSELRAKAAADYLSSKGIDKERITTIGYGETRPIAPNSTSEGRARNRRVEFRII